MAILTHKCPHCLTNGIALRIVAKSPIEERKYAIYLACPKCHLPSAAVTERNPTSGSTAEVLTKSELGEIGTYGWSILQFWPLVTSPAAPLYTPPEVERVYLQAERNFPTVGNEEAAGTMYRKALDLALKRLDPSLTGMLGQKIKQMQGKLTPEILEWCGHVRLLGNDAAHDDDAISRDDLTDLRNFSEMVLQYLFTLPGMVKKRRGEKLDWE